MVCRLLSTMASVAFSADGNDIPHPIEYILLEIRLLPSMDII